MSEPHSVRIVEPRTPKHVVCPYCGLRQPFVKETEYWRTVKTPHLKHPYGIEDPDGLCKMPKSRLSS